MPIFMDLHRFPEEIEMPSREQLYQAHLLDMKLQKKYFVKYILYIVNMETRSVFCVLEAPDAQSCHDLHMEAHGTSACHIVEVQGGDFVNYIGDLKHVNEFDMIELGKGIPDTGYRTLLAYRLDGIPNAGFEKTVSKILSSYQNVSTTSSGDTKIFIFTETDNAIEFGASLLEAYESVRKENEELSVTIVAGQPVNEKSEKIFGTTVDELLWLLQIARPGSILVSHQAAYLRKFTTAHYKKMKPLVMFLNFEDSEFLIKLHDKIELLTEAGNLTTETLANEMGISQSGLYRKINKLTGLSIVAFLQELKLQDAFQKLSQGNTFISGIAYECGFSSPSYFTRSFRKRYHKTPAEVSKAFSGKVAD